MKSLKQQLILSGLVIVLFSACNKKAESDNSQEVTGRPAADRTQISDPQSPNGANAANATVLQAGVNGLGGIQPQNSSQGPAFEAQVKSLLSATLPPSAIGSIAASNGVFIEGCLESPEPNSSRIRIEGGGNSRIKITVRDSLAGTVDKETKKTIPAIVLSIPMTDETVEVTSGARSNLVFADDFGTITLANTYLSLQNGVNYLIGDVQFDNREVYEGAPQGTTPGRGTIGWYYIQASFIVKRTCN